jgi:hypothetical protein
MPHKLKHHPHRHLILAFQEERAREEQLNYNSHLCRRRQNHLLLRYRLD